MTSLKKNENLGKSNCKSLAAITASLIFAQLSEGSGSNTNYKPPNCAFLDAMICGFSIEHVGMNVPSDPSPGDGSRW